MTTQHTPGPWRHPHVLGVGRTADWKIETPRGDLIIQQSIGIGSLEQKSNAALIAAAPDLLDILIAIVQSADECDVPDNPAGVPLVSVDSRLIESARAAIAKSRGEGQGAREQSEP